MSDVACEPEFPPELMMSGMNRASTTAFASYLKVPHRRGRQHLAQEKRRQPRRAFSDHREESDLGVGLVQCLHSAEALDVFGVLFHQCVDDVIDRDHSLNHPVVVDDGHRYQVVLARQSSYFFAIGSYRDSLYFLPGDVGNLPALWRGEQLAERHHALDAPSRIGGVDRIHRFAPL